MAILHTVNKSPFEKTALQSCLDHASPGDAVLLIEDGVYAAISQTSASERIAARKNEVSFYALGPDLLARGVGNGSLAEGVKVVGYDGFVDLVAEYEIAQAWL